MELQEAKKKDGDPAEKSEVQKRLEAPVWQQWRAAKKNSKSSSNKEENQEILDHGKLGNAGRCKLYRAINKVEQLEKKLEYLEEDADKFKK